jgi:hypothetical protein
MALYKISDQSVTMNLKPSRDIGNSRNSIVPKPQPTTRLLTLCTNFFNNNSNICDVRKVNDRFSAYGLIKSSNLEAVSNNNNLPDPLANFTGSYFDIIHLPVYYKPIKN